MALINCPECGHQVSDIADACPSCGYPISKMAGSSRQVVEVASTDAVPMQPDSLREEAVCDEDDIAPEDIPSYLGLESLKIKGVNSTLKIMEDLLSFDVNGKKSKIPFSDIRAFGFRENIKGRYGRLLLATDDDTFELIFKPEQQGSFAMVYRALLACFPGREIDGETYIGESAALVAHNQSMSKSSPELTCPKCGSNQVTAQKKGFSAGKAVAGAAIGVATLGTAGIIGVAAGSNGAKKIRITCMNCGHSWIAGKRK